MTLSIILVLAGIALAAYGAFVYVRSRTNALHVAVPRDATPEDRAVAPSSPLPPDHPALGPAPIGKRWQVGKSGLAEVVDITHRAPPPENISTVMHEFEMAYKHAAHACELADKWQIEICKPLLNMPDVLHSAIADQTAAQLGDAVTKLASDASPAKSVGEFHADPSHHFGHKGEKQTVAA